MARKVTFVELPGWAFEVDEKSSGVYEAIGRSKNGATVVATASDPHEAIAGCMRSAGQDG